MADTWRQRRRVNILQPANVKGIPVMRNLLEKNRAQHRHERERKDERAEQRKCDRERQRREHLSLEPFQREQRQEDDDDNENSEDHRPADFLGCVEHGFRFTRALMLFGPLGQMAMDVFHHHDRAVRHHADADGEAA